MYLSSNWFDFKWCGFLCLSLPISVKNLMLFTRPEWSSCYPRKRLLPLWAGREWTIVDYFRIFPFYFLFIYFSFFLNWEDILFCPPLSSNVSICWTHYSVESRLPWKMGFVIMKQGRNGDCVQNAFTAMFFFHEFFYYHLFHSCALSLIFLFAFFFFFSWHHKCLAILLINKWSLIHQPVIWWTPYLARRTA